MNGLTGKWTCVSATVNGNALPADVTTLLQLVMTADRYTTLKGSEVLLDSTYSIDTSVRPHRIDIVGTEGEFRGKSAQGIYELDGDSLRLCYTMPGGERPTDFASAPGSQAFNTGWRKSPESAGHA